MTYAIEVGQLHKKYSGRRGVHALRGIDLHVEPGTIFGLLGPNGAGKTTLVRILLSITRPSSGSALLFGERNTALSVKQRLGYLAENHRFPQYLTGDHILKYFGALSGLHGKFLQNRVDSVLDVTSMREWRNTKVRKYSKGMLQRIGLAQAMINNPDLLFLDEPTDGVDPIGRREIREVLIRLKNEGKTIFLNSHLLSEVEMITDRVAILNRGELVKTGSVGELTSAGNRVEISVGELGEATWEAVKALYPDVERKGETAFSIPVERPETLDAVIDCLRARRVSIRHVLPAKQSLEDFFIQVIQEKRA